MKIRLSERDAAVFPRLPGIGLFPGYPRLEAAFIAVELTIFLTGIFLFVHFSRELTRFTDARLLEPGASGGPALLLSAPGQIWVGEETTPAVLQTRLRNALYAQGDTGSPVGTFKPTDQGLEIYPGPASYFNHGQIREGGAVLQFHGGRISAIKSPDGRSTLQSYWLEPEVITTLSGFARSEQHLLRYQDIPPVLLNAVIAAEDHRFFSHHGVNPVRIYRAARADMKADKRAQGGSTLTMQLARNLFLTPRRTFDRKLEEVGLAVFLETRLSKKQIFELYANRIYVGQQGNFGIFGLGDAAQAYFHKDVDKLNLPEAAFLAGMIRAPNLYSPYKYPERALERRNTVLRQMVETGYISKGDAERAIRTPLNPAQPTVVEARQEGYFEDMVVEQLRNQFSERQINFAGLRVYTTLDLDLQRGASEGAQLATTEIDQHARRPKPAKNAPATVTNQPQIALVAMDPRTGDVKALVGGRDYGSSQLNHVLARRQPGSSFKPFVYAAALSSGVDGSQPVITPATILQDQPTQFRFGNKWDKPYTPRDYQGDYHGAVTVRDALAYSLNVPAVSLAQMTGYDKVRKLAIAAGFNSQLEATPSIALGSYEATPLEVTGAYTIFANQGQHVEPRCIVEVDDAAGNAVWTRPVVERPVLDPRVSYLMVNLMQGVIDRGTGAGVRTRGFTLPAAGKTGTSHDGWFAGFTPNLLAVAWVGYDDNRELNLTGAQSALPFWTEFMKRATYNPTYRNAGAFTVPSGIVSVPVETEASTPDSTDPTVATTQVATTRYEVFIQGTEHAATVQTEPAADVVAGTEEPAPEAPAASGGQLLGATLHDPPTPQTDKAPEDPASVVQPTPPPAPPNPGEASPPEKKTSGAPLAGDGPTGPLRVVTDPPGLQVFVDGKSVGSSPLSINLPVGQHTCKIAPPPGREPAQETVQITENGRKTVTVHY